MPLAVFPSVSPQPGKRAEVTQRPKLPKSSSYRREAGRDGGAEDPAQKEKASPVAPEHRGIIFSTFTSGCRVFKTKALPSGISSLLPLQPGLHEIKGQLDVLVSPFWARPHMARGGTWSLNSFNVPDRTVYTNSQISQHHIQTSQPASNLYLSIS